MTQAASDMKRCRNCPIWGQFMFTFLIKLDTRLLKQIVIIFHVLYDQKYVYVEPSIIILGQINQYCH